MLSFIWTNYSSNYFLHLWHLRSLNASLRWRPHIVCSRLSLLIREALAAGRLSLILHLLLGVSEPFGTWWLSTLLEAATSGSWSQDLTTCWVRTVLRTRRNHSNSWRWLELLNWLSVSHSRVGALLLVSAVDLCLAWLLLLLLVLSIARLDCSGLGCTLWNLLLWSLLLLWSGGTLRLRLLA